MTQSAVFPFLPADDPAFRVPVTQRMIDAAIVEVRSFCEARMVRLSRGGAVMSDLISPTTGRVQRPVTGLASAMGVTTQMAEVLVHLGVAQGHLEIERRSIRLAPGVTIPTLYTCPRRVFNRAAVVAYVSRQKQTRVDWREKAGCEAGGVGAIG